MTSRFTIERVRWLVAFPVLAIFLTATFGCEPVRPAIEHLAELCAWSTFTVTDPTDVGPGGDLYCDWTTGECHDLREALNTANLCAAEGPKTVELPIGGLYQIGSPNLPPAYRKQRSERDLLRVGGDVGLPPIFGSVRVEGNGSVIEISDDVSGIRHFLVNGSGDLTLENLTLRVGRSPRGGSIFNEGRLATSNVLFEGNEADDAGGAIFSAVGAETVLESTQIENGRGPAGAAVFAEGPEPGPGGACPAGGSPGLVIRGSQVVDHFERRSPGTIVHVDRCASARIVGTTIHDNALVDGAVHSRGEILLQSSTISNNDGINVGGLHVYSGSAIVESSTFTGNDANTISAIRCAASVGTTLSLTDVTVTRNTATTQAGLAVSFNTECHATAANTIIGENSGPDCGTINPIVEMGENATTDGSCFASVVPTPLGLGGLADNGGPTRTILPAAGSPLVGAGTVCLARDQRGAPRPVGACELGAVERQ